MRVILTQAEIEAAVIAAVRDQIEIKDGLVVTVELKQTRGAEGMTAEVDFVPPSVPSKTVTKRAPKAEVAADPKPNVAAESSTPTATVADSGVQEQSSGAATATGETGSAEAQPSPEAETAEGTAAATDKPVSLFATLARNKPAEAQAE